MIKSSSGPANCKVYGYAYVPHAEHALVSLKVSASG